MNGPQARGVVTRKRILQMISLREQAGNAPPPTIREIAKVLGLSPASIHRQIALLTEMGFLEREPGLARTIRRRRGEGP